MLTSDDKIYDAIVIGAGISGLVCGSYLAKAGLKVLIVEQHTKPGGYFTSFKKKGFLFDAAAHSFGNYREGGHVRKILSDLGVSDLITINRHNPSDVIITPDFKLTFRNDINETTENLGSVFPHEESNIKKFFSFLVSNDQTEFAKLKDKTFLDLLSDYFKDKKLISSLALPVFGNGGLPPSFMYAFNGAKIFSEFLIDGGYYPEGGIQKLPDSLARIILDNKGVLLYKKLVYKILYDRHSVCGIQLASGERFRSNHVISACDLTQTLTTLLDKELSSAETLTRLDSMTPSLSTFILYIGIDKPFEGLSAPGTNVWYLSDYDLDYVYSNIEKCIFDDPTAFMYRVSPDHKTILAFMSAPFASPLFWGKNKQFIAESFLSRIKRIIPNLADHIVYFDAASPTTLQRYTLNRKGAAFGWAKLPEQTADIILNKTPILKGLYYAGHWTNIGFGLPGTCYSGWDTAKRILRKTKKTSKSTAATVFK
jgi:phytoene dehydrogenase-like protein